MIGAPEKYPVRNRLQTDLDPLRIRIMHREGTVEFDPNSLLLAILNGEHERWKPLSMDSELGAGRGAVVYRSGNVRLVLTPGEVARLVLHNLDQDEFFMLAEKYGSFFEIHDDFYDWESGTALQPVERA